MLKKAERIIGNETADEGLRRLEAERMREVAGKSTGWWNNEFMFNLSKSSSGLRDAELSLGFVGYDMSSDPRCVEKGLISQVSLCYEGVPIANSSVMVRKPGGRVEAVIEVLQGMGNAGQMEKFRTATGEHWNIFLANAIKDAAYESGFNRVLLRDITTTKDYERPFMLRGKTIAETRELMQQLYTRTRKQCGFTKREGDYFVREFP